MTPLVILHTITSTGQIIASAPQILKIYKNKRADDISLTTWLIWLLAQVVAFFYIISREEWLMALMSAGWVMTYLAVVALAIYYRYYLAPTRPPKCLLMRVKL